MDRQAAASPRRIQGPGEGHGYAGNRKAKRKDQFVLLYFEVAKEYTQEYVRPDSTAGCLDRQWKKIEGQYQRIVNAHGRPRSQRQRLGDQRQHR